VLRGDMRFEAHVAQEGIELYFAGSTEKNVYGVRFENVHPDQQRK
jgi:hypothetical protein